jgi:transcriptional regulator with XRE-family HTH domain
MNEYYAFYMDEPTPTSDLLAAIEVKRTLVGLSQEKLAEQLGMSQGHYSKLVSGRVILGQKSLTRIQRWLEQQPISAPDDDARRAEIRRLADQINMQCMKLVMLTSNF